MAKQWICPDCGSTYVQEGPIVPGCTFCGERAGWFKDSEDGLWKPPHMKGPDGQ